jgi:hypothetical protein
LRARQGVEVLHRRRIDGALLCDALAEAWIDSNASLLNFRFFDMVEDSPRSSATQRAGATRSKRDEANE